MILRLAEHALVEGERSAPDRRRGTVRGAAGASVVTTVIAPARSMPAGAASRGIDVNSRARGELCDLGVSTVRTRDYCAGLSHGAELVAGRS